MLKAELRNTYKEKRILLSSVEKNKLDDLLLIQFQQLPIDMLLLKSITNLILKS